MFSKVYKFGFLIECLGYCWWTLSNQFMRLKDLIFNIDTENAFEPSQLLSRMNWSIKNCWYLNSIDILLTSSSNISTKLPNIMNFSQIYGWVWIKHLCNSVKRPFLLAFLIFPSQNVILVIPDKTEACECQLQGVRFRRNFVTRGLFWGRFPKSWEPGWWWKCLGPQVFNFFIYLGPTFFAPKQIGWMDL